MQTPPLEVLLPWLPALFVPWLLALGLTPLVGRFARARGLLDLPRGRKQHEGAIPLLGGIALLAAVGLGLLAVAPWSEPIRRALWGERSLAALGFGALAMVALGTWDDLRELGPTFRAVVQLAIASATWWLGFRCGEVELPFGYVISSAPAVSFLLTIGWIVMVTNAFNLIDGIDGLTAGTGIVAGLVIFFLASKHGVSVPVIGTLALVGALAGFLRFNLPPARIFLGDGGALGIGYAVAVLAMASSQKSTTAVVLIVPLLVLGLPLVDTLGAILRRAAGHLRERGTSGLNPIDLGRAVMSGDRGHVHYLLLRAGWSVRGVLFLLYGLSAALGVLALAIREESPLVRWACWIGLLAAGFAALQWMESRVRRREEAVAARPGAAVLEPQRRRGAAG